MEHSKFYSVLKTRWANINLPITSYLEAKGNEQEMVQKREPISKKDEKIIAEIAKEFDNITIEGFSLEREVKLSVIKHLRLLKRNKNEILVKTFVDEILKEIKLSKPDRKKISEQVFRHTFHPKATRTHPPDYCIDDTYCIREFVKYPHDSLFTQDIKTIDSRVSEMLENIKDLEKSTIQPGTIEHDDTLRYYCQFIYTINELRDIERKLISFERRFYVRNLMENSIIGLLRCKNKLTTVEASNITYTIKTILLLGIPVKKIQTEIPLINTHLRVENIKELILKFKESLDETNELKSIEKIQNESNEEQNILIDDDDEGDKIESNSINSIMTESEKEPTEYVTLIDMMEHSLNDKDLLGNRAKNLMEEPIIFNPGRLKNNFDDQSMSLLEKLLYQRILIRRSPRLFSFKVNELSEKRLDEYGVFLQGIEDLFGDRVLGAKRKKLLILIQKHWRGYLDRQRVKLPKEKHLLFYNLIKSSSSKKVQERKDEIKEDQKAYLELYERIYSLIIKFIDSNKKFEYARGTLLEVLDDWRNDFRDIKEIPVTIKNFNFKIQKPNYIGLIEYEDVFDFLRIGIKSISKKKDILDLNREFNLEISKIDPNVEINQNVEMNSNVENNPNIEIHPTIEIDPNTPKIHYDTLRAEIHKEMNPLTKDNEFKNLRALLSTEKENTLQNKISNQEIDLKIVKSPTPSATLESINLSIMNYEKDFLTIKKELRKAKCLIERRKEQSDKENKKSEIAYNVTPALTNVAKDAFVDLFSNIITTKEVDGIYTLKKDNDKSNVISNTGSSSDTKIKDIVKELIENNIIVSYPESKMDDFYGTLCYANEDIILEAQLKKVRDPIYTSQWVIQAVKEFCILPFFSEKTHSSNPIIKSVFLGGPPKCGKNLIVNAVCTHLGAVKFDLSADTIRKSAYYKNDMLQTLENHILEAGRYLQPSVFYVNEAHTPYLLSNPPKVSEGQNILSIILEAQMKKNNPDKSETSDPEVNKTPDLYQFTFDNSFLKDILARLVNEIRNNDLMLIMGISNKPFMSDIKIVEQTFNKILVFPRLNYNTVRQYLSEKIMAIENVDRKFNFHVLADLCTGLPIPYMQPLIDYVLSLERQAKLCGPNPTPLDTEEFLEILTPLRDKIVSKAYERSIFEWFAESKIGKQRTPTLKKWNATLQTRKEETTRNEEIARNEEITKNKEITK